MTVPRHQILDFLLSRSAHTVPHLNGNLFDHLVATEALLRSWGCPEVLCRAGLCHATYGTDGFAPFLVSPDDRAPLAEAAGPQVEETVYLYASCDRSFLYPQLPGDGPVRFRDRFRRTTSVLGPAPLRHFVDLTVANEMEIATTADDGAGNHGAGNHGAGNHGAGNHGAGGPPPWVGPLLDAIDGRASPSVRAGARSLLAARFSSVPVSDRTR